MDDLQLWKGLQDFRLGRGTREAPHSTHSVIIDDQELPLAHDKSLVLLTTAFHPKRTLGDPSLPLVERAFPRLMPRAG